MALSSASIGWTSVSRPAHHLDWTVALADVAADDLDAVAAEVDDAAATGLTGIPEPGAVRTRMGLPAAHPQHVADRPGAHGRQRLQRLRGVDEVLQIAGEDAGRLDEIEDPLGLLGGAGERFGAQHRLAGGRRRGDRLLVHVVGQADDDGVDAGVVDGVVDARRRPWHVPPLLERFTALDGTRVDDVDAVAAAPAVQRHRVEVADQSGAEHGNAMVHDQDSRSPPCPVLGF